MTKRCCPHCGNTDQKTIADNGEPESSEWLTLLCTALVDPKDRSWTHVEPDPVDPNATGEVSGLQLDAAGKVACGFQWSPNEG